MNTPENPEAELADDDAAVDVNCCYEGWDEFHDDDCGGYNPPCPCGCGRCRSCCEQAAMEDAEHDDSWGDDA